MRRGTIKHKTPSKMLSEPADNTSKYVWLQVYQTYLTDTVINVEIAREIANWYKAPSGTGRLYLFFAQDGSINDVFLDDIANEIKLLVLESNMDEGAFANLMALSALMKYCHAVLSEQN